LKYPKPVILWKIKELHNNGESQGKLEKKGLLTLWNNFSNFRKLPKVEGLLVIKLGSPKNGKVNYLF
jgi:hypothetical protein